MHPIGKYLLLPALILLAGCASTPANTPITAQPGTIQGSVHGGQQPVAGSTIQLYASGTTGDGSTATPLLTAPVLTTANGGFTLTGLFTCPSTSSLVYIVATGGNPGLGAGGNNPQLALMAALGPCGNLTPSTFISINEVTTVGAIYGLADYMASFTAIGSGSSDASALANAFTYSLELVNTSTGSSPGANVPAGTTIPVAQINTIADAMASCINSPGGASNDGSPCGSLIYLTTPAGATPPTNTIGALLNLALNPALNTTAIYNLIVPAAPFQPIDATAPGNFAVSPNTSSTLIITPTSVTFPPQSVGFVSPVQTVNVQNSGASTVTFSPMTINGIDSSDFTQTSSCGTIAAGASCQIQLTVTPGALGNRVAALTITSNTAASPQTVSISATGAAPSAGPVSVSPTTISTNYAGLYNDVTVSNYGTTPLSLSGATVSNTNFSIAANDCGTTLAPQSICTISVVSNVSVCIYTCPSSPQTATGTLTITDDAVGGPQTVQLSSANTETVTGHLTFPPTAVGSSASSGISAIGYEHEQQANFGGTFAGPDPGDFTAPPQNYLNSSVFGCAGIGSPPVWQACSFNVTFAPSANGPRTAKLQNFYGNGYTLLTGVGIGGNGPGFTVPSSLSLPAYANYNGIAITSGNLTIVNTGNTTLHFVSPQIFSSTPVPFSLSGNCTAVAPGTSCMLTVGFSAPVPVPGAYTSYNASLVLTDSTSGQTQTVVISAVAQYSYPVITPSTLAFGSVQVGSISSTQTFSVADQNGNPLGHPVQASFLYPADGFILAQMGCPASTTGLCSIGAAFQPTVAGGASTYIRVTDTFTGYATGISISGTATPPPGAPVISLSQTSLTFPLRSIGTTSIPMTVNLNNTGTAALTISAITVIGAVNNNYTQTNNCGAVPVGGSCTINVTFAPTSVGTQSATIQIVSNAPSSPDTISITGTAQ